MNKLSERLEMVASLVPNGVNCADIGADHGYLIIELMNRNIINRGYGCENKFGPYSRLKDNINKNNLNTKIDIELSDGIKTLPSYINAVIIAGMGGDTICQIINDGTNKLENVEYFIISSHSKMSEVRRLLSSKGYYIDSERTCYDSSLYYESSLFKKGVKNYTEDEFEFGPILLKNKDKNLFKKIQDKIIFNQNLIKNGNIPSSRILEINTENSHLNEILKLLK